MREISDRRARKKARTRAEIVGAAHDLFARHGFDAVTIADVADAADVAVQTVFNHFSSKEELYFDGRAPWVEGPADAVRDRLPHVAPLAALREFTLRTVRQYATGIGTGEYRELVGALTTSPALARYDLSLQHRSEQMLAEALTEALDEARAADPGCCDATDTRMVGSLVASLWVSGARALIRELRGALVEGADAERITRGVEELAEHVFQRLEVGMGTLLELPAGFVHPVLRAG